MNKKTLWVALAITLIIILGSLCGWLVINLQQQQAANQEMMQLAEMDKLEMENEYQKFALQYGEMKSQINNDSLVAQLDREQLRTEELLEELKRVKANDAAEIRRLKKELETVRAVMRSYIVQIDSLNRLNQALTAENAEVKQKYTEATLQISNLAEEKQSLSERVAVAAQLDATGITVTAKNKKGKVAKKVKDVTRLAINFNIAKNVTAPTGEQTIYVRLMRPTGEVLTRGGHFEYENKQLEYSIKKVVEYAGEELPVAVYWDVEEFLSEGTYRIHIFAAGNMIGQSTFTLK